MEIFSQSQIIIANSGSFGINTNILETNLINQIILIAVLFVFVGNALKESLGQRQAEIINGVEDSEKRLSEATNRLAEAKKQLSQARLIIAGIKNRTQLTKVNILESDYVQAKNELNRRFSDATTTLKNRERLMLSEIKQNISLLALTQALKAIESRELGITEKNFDIYLDERIKDLKTAGLSKK